MSIALTLILAFGFGHTGMHMLQNILVPGLGLHERSLTLAIAVFVLVMFGIVAWVRWGVDWLPLTVLVLSTLAAGVPVQSSHHHAVIDLAMPQVAAHEFPIVVAVVAAIVWLQASLKSIPIVRRLVAMRIDQAPQILSQLPAQACSQGAVLSCLAGVDRDEALRAARSDQVSKRARLISQVARFRFGDNIFAVDHGLARAGLAMTNGLAANEQAVFIADGSRAPGGVPCSEPGWIRLLDGTLTAVALEEAGDKEAGARWQQMLAGPLQLKRGHRPAMWWTGLGIRFGNTQLWEHALAMAIAYQRGWCGLEDWAHLRPQLLGAAARGVEIVDDERAIAAGQLWLNWLDDSQATRILNRPTIHRDPLARVIEAYGKTLAEQQASAN